MIQRIAILFYLVFCTFSLKAQGTSHTNTANPACQLAHVLGGNIAVHNNAGNNYTLTVTLYRDTFEYPFPSNILTDIYTFDSGIAELVFDSTLIIPMDSALFNSMAPLSPYRTQAAYYSYPLNLPAGGYQFVYISCCKNPLILNAQQVSAANSVFHTELTVLNGAKNSTPHMFQIPVYQLELNREAVINPLPCDDDADSLSIDFVTPLAAYISSPTSSFSDVMAFTTPPGNLNLNHISGEITYTPNAQGNYIQSFQVKEYRAGVEIGSVIDDLEFLVASNGGTDTLSLYPQNAVSYNTYQNYNYLLYTPGQPLTFQINGAISDTAGTVSMNASGSVFNLGTPATFTTTGTGSSISGTFSWTPPAAFSNTMIVVFRLTQAGGTLVKDYTLVLRSSIPPTNEVIQPKSAINKLVLYPNPVHNTLHLSLSVLDAPVNEISLVSILGKKVAVIYNGKLDKGEYDFNKDISLAPGIYNIIVRSGGSVTDTKRVIVE